MDKLWAFFENIDEIVYAADIETHELVYMNNKALETFGLDSLEEVKGETCYHVLQNCAVPCALCNNKKLEPGRFMQWQYFNPYLGRRFLLKDTIIEENGRRYRVEIARDISGQEQQGGMVQSVQNLETIINEGLRVALLEKTPDQSLEVLLEYLGKALDGERTYIFEKNESGCDDNTYEWVANGVQPEKENLQNVPPEVCANWYRNFSVGKYIVIKDLEEIRQTDPAQYENLKRQNIHSLVVVPLYDDGKIIGFYGVDNPPVKSLDYTSNMLQITAHFIVSSLRRRDLVRELQKRSYDVLYSLNVDYVGIYQVDFDSDKCEVYRENERLRGDTEIDFKNGYQAAMERYISLYVAPRDQEHLRTMTEKSRVLDQLRSKKKFYIRYQVKDNPQGLKNFEIHFSATGKAAEEHTAVFAFRDVNSVVEQEEKYKLDVKRDIEDILESARTGIWTMELEEGCPPRMYADRTMRALLGVQENIEPEECYRQWFENIEPDYVDIIQEAVQEMLRSGCAEVDYPWNHPELGKIYVRCGGVPDRNFNKPGVCLRGYHQDITETMVMRQEHAKTLMETLMEVKRANSAKAEFLSHMSHDIRTPINGILGMLTILEKNLDDPEKQKDCMKKIRMAAEHLLSLINDVLEISKLESGKSTLVREPFNLRDILENCTNILSPKAEETGIRLEAWKTDIQHGGLIGSPLHLRQILINVMGNAVKYNRPNGSVFLRVEELPAKDGYGEFRFTVEDTGIGMTEDFQKHIFEPFVQEKQDARTNYNGTGLGMTITKNLVDQMGGTIELESRLGAGSRFRISLPFQIDEKQEPLPGKQEGDESIDISGMRVLVAEDNALNCEIVQYMLEDAGAAVVTAENGKIAVDIFAASEPGTFDCVLMDLMMPVMDGLEAARIIRGMDRPDVKTLPMIALSANSFCEDAITVIDAGMDEHLSKPVDMEKLFKTMRRLKNEKA